MKLAHIKIKDFRSFSGEHDFDFSSGVNYVVGPNNCGKSNLVRALELSLDPTAVYVPERDRPVRERVGPPPKTRITLTFKVGNTDPEKTLLLRAQSYERAVREAAERTGGSTSYADEREIRLVTSFGNDGTRQVSFQARGSGARSLPAESEEHRRLEQQFRSVVRFGVIHSGQDLGSLLKGKFREILRLVIQDHLREELESAEKARQVYLESLQSSLLEPLRSQVQSQVGSMFREITVADLIPDVPTVQETLSSVDIQLGDAITTTGLTDKGTGVRGAVLLSMLQYLAEQSKRSLVIAVEEPEAFLHPAAQEAIRGHLEELATRADVSLLVTTHSPYVISRRGDAMVTELRKGADGFTVKGGVSTEGHPRLADLMSPLFRDAGVAQMLDRALQVPESARVVVITEGYTDGLFIRQVCAANDRDALLEGIYFQAAGSAAKVVAHALLTQAGTSVPVIALLDSDDHGRAAGERLTKLEWSRKSNVLLLNDWPNACRHHATEIEHLLPRRAVETLVNKMGEQEAVDGTQRCGSIIHLQLSKAWKERAIQELPRHLPVGDLGGIEWLLQEIRQRGDRMRNQQRREAEHVSSDATVRRG